MFEFSCLKKSMRRLKMDSSQIIMIVMTWRRNLEQGLFGKYIWSIQPIVLNFHLEQIFIIFFKILTHMRCLKSILNRRGFNVFNCEGFCESFCLTISFLYLLDRSFINFNFNGNLIIHVIFIFREHLFNRCLAFLIL